IALAGDQGRRDRPGIAFQRRANAAVDPVAYRLNGDGKAEPQPRRDGRRPHIDSSQCEAGGADPLEIEVSGQIIAAGTKRRCRRIEARLEEYKRADRRRRALAHREADALRPVGETRTLHRGDAYHDAIAALALLARLHETR